MPQLPLVEGPYQHFQDSILGALRDLNAADLCRRQGFRNGPLWDFRGSMQSLTLPMLGTETRHCFERSFLEEFGMVFSWAICEEKTFHVVFVEAGWGWSFVLGM